MKIKKIEGSEKYFMIGGAIIFDIAEFFLTPTVLVAVCSGVVQYGIYGIWFWIHGTFFFAKAKISKSAGKSAYSSTKELGSKIKSEGSNIKVGFSWSRVFALIAESIPVIEALPIFTITVISQINNTNKRAESEEEKETNENLIREKLSKNVQNKTPNSKVIRPKKQ